MECSERRTEKKNNQKQIEMYSMRDTVYQFFVLIARSSQIQMGYFHILAELQITIDRNKKTQTPTTYFY